MAARETSTGTATYAYKNLSGSYSELWGQAWVYVVSRSTSANLIGFRGSNGGSIINLYLSQTGKLALRNNAGGVTTTSATAVPTVGWHKVVLHVIVNGAASSVDVSLDGATVADLALSGQNFGANPTRACSSGKPLRDGPMTSPSTMSPSPRRRPDGPRNPAASASPIAITALGWPPA